MQPLIARLQFNNLLKNSKPEALTRRPLSRFLRSRHSHIHVHHAKSRRKPGFKAKTNSLLIQYARSHHS
jgi:hypothetical protein